MKKVSPLTVNDALLTVACYVPQRIILILILLFYLSDIRAQSPCPSVGGMIFIEDVCAGDSLSLQNRGLININASENGEANFGLVYVSFPGVIIPEDPYDGGDTIAREPWEGIIQVDDIYISPRAGGGSQLPPGSYVICAILDPIPSDSACQDSRCQQINITSGPVAAFIAPGDVCEGARPILLDSGMPERGVYSGEGVFAGDRGGFEFKPDSVGIGVYTISYTVTNREGCSSTATDSIEVFANPVVTISDPQDRCNGGADAVFIGGPESTGTFNSDATGGFVDNMDGTAVLDVSVVGVGNYRITYDYTDDNGCAGTAATEISICKSPCPELSEFEEIGTTCQSEEINFLINRMTLMDSTDNGERDYGILFTVFDGEMTPSDPYEPGDTLTIVNRESLVRDETDSFYQLNITAENNLTVGSHTICATLSPLPGDAECRPFLCQTISISPSPTVTLIAPVDGCISEGIQENISGSIPANGTYSGPGVIDNNDGNTYNFDPVKAGAGAHKISYTYTSPDSIIIYDNIGFDEVATFVTSDASNSIIVSDDFSLTDNNEINKIAWSGFYAGSVPPESDDFTIVIYGDDGGTPDMPDTILSTIAIGNEVNRVDTGVDIFGGDVYKYTADISSFDALAGTTYWISIYNNMNAWAWSRKIGGDGNAIASNDQGSSWTIPVGGEFDFRLIKELVPCTVTATDTVEVFAVPIVDFTALPDLCIDAGIQINLNGGTPAGGTYSGPGVSANIDGSYNFNPMSAGADIHTITYNFTDENNCMATATDIVEVFALPAVTETHQDISECTGETKGSIDLTVPDNEIFIFNWSTSNGSGIINGNEDQSNLSVGVYMVTVTNDATFCNTLLTIEIMENTDLLAPVITCPSDRTISCVDDQSTANLGVATAKDNCDPEPVISFIDNSDLSGCNGTGQIIRTWMATDRKNNVSTCEQIITVADNDPPVFDMTSNVQVVNCPKDIPAPVALTATDECSGPITVMPEVSTIGQVCPNEFTRVYTYTFVDDCGNATIFTQSYQVVTNPPELLSSPPDYTVACELDIVLYPSLVSVNSACNGLLEITAVLNGPFGPAGCAGTTYEAVYSWTDGCHTNSVKQIYTLENEGPEFVCPSGVCTIDCLSDINNMQNSFDNYAELATVNTSCAASEITITNDFSENNFINNNCGNGSTINNPDALEYQIVTFTATDACSRSTNCTVLVIIVDDTPPVFNGTPVVGIADCGKDLQTAYEDWASAQIIRLDATDVCGFDGVAAVSYSPSTPITSEEASIVTPVTFIASDGCGNSSSLTASFVVKNQEIPSFAEVPADATINCDELPVVFGEIILNESCSPAAITFDDQYVSGNIQSCNNQEVAILRRTWTATDAAGKSSTASQQITIIPGRANVAGTIFTEENEFVSNVNLAVYLNSGMMDEQTTTEEGTYEFELPVQQDYEIAASRNDDPLNGISTYDLVLLGQHLLEINLLESPYQMIAADVNNSGSVTALDMIALRRVILAIDTTFQNNESWRFIDADYLFPNSDNPFVSTFPESYSINGLSNDMIRDFIAIKTGDLNHSAVVNNINEGDTRQNRKIWSLGMEQQSIKRSQSYEIPVTVRESGLINGFQYTLEFDPKTVTVKSVEPTGLDGLNSENFGTHALDEGWLTTSWHRPRPVRVNVGDTLFTIKFTALRDQELREVFSISSSKTPAEMYTASELFLPRLTFRGSDDYKVYQNVPNPFFTTTSIGFEQPVAGPVTLAVYNIHGEEVYRTEGDFDRGYQEIKLEKRNLDNNVVLFYRIDFKDFFEIKKMILLK